MAFPPAYPAIFHQTAASGHPPRCCMDSDKAACAEVIQAWGFARDQGRWDDLAAIFHPGGELAVPWFRGPYPEFVAHCARNYGRGSEAKHLLWPARVAVNGARAAAQTNVAILVR